MQKCKNCKPIYNTQSVLYLKHAVIKQISENVKILNRKSEHNLLQVRLCSA